MAAVSEPIKVYLGDGLYGEFDGYGIRLKADRDNRAHWVYLNPEVMESYLTWIKALIRLYPQLTEGHEQVTDARSNIMPNYTITLSSDGWQTIVRMLSFALDRMPTSGDEETELMEFVQKIKQQLEKQSNS